MMTNSSHVSIETLDAIMKAFNDHDLDSIMEFFADDSSFDTSAGPADWGERIIGKAAIRKYLAGRFTQTPDAHYQPDRHWIHDRLAVSEWTFTGTAPDDRKLRVSGCNLWEFQNQKIVRKDSYRKMTTVSA